MSKHFLCLLQPNRWKDLLELLRSCCDTLSERYKVQTPALYSLAEMYNMSVLSGVNSMLGMICQGAGGICAEIGRD
jgi:hypothetical protein